MVRERRRLAVLTLTGVLGACAQGSPLIFVQTDTFGVTINTGATNTSPELTLGYRGIDAAVVPVTYSPTAGTTTPLLGEASGSGSDTHEALSVIGQFEANAQASGACVGLGKFFATGLAAKKLADGFFYKLAAGSSSSSPASAGGTCTNSPASSAALAAVNPSASPKSPSPPTPPGMAPQPGVAAPAAGLPALAPARPAPAPTN